MAVSAPVGTLLSERYRLERKIGTGGMSTVYVAFDTVLERQVAIKLMHREIASDSDQLERFRREARAVARLNHPHIVAVIDAGEDESPGFGHAMPYIVFEYVEGETLKQRIRRFGRLPISEAVAYAIEVARALGAAHAAGIVHRDVKPQNVLLDAEGSAKVTDFGIARTLDQEGLTADGRVLGTTDYVSPEQALGHSVTGQSDLYSLGVVLYEMLTGEVPFSGENQVQVAMKHVREELPDVTVKRPEVSATLASVLEHATAKDLDKRYADDQELIADLESVLAVETQRAGHADGEATAVLRTLPPQVRARVTDATRQRARLWLAVGIVLLLGVAAAWYVLGHTKPGTNQRPVSKPPPGLDSISLGQSRAHDFDPGSTDADKTEHPEEARALFDDNPATSWSTENYREREFAVKTPDARGVGIYLDAKPKLAAEQLQLRTSTPGWSGRVLVSNKTPDRTTLDGWKDIDAQIKGDRRKITVDLDTGGTAYRYYLIWITRLPPLDPATGKTAVKISDASLLAPKSAQRG